MTVFGSGLARYFVSVLGLGVFFLGLNYVNYGRHTSLQAEKAACNQAPPQEIVKVNLRFYGNLEALKIMQSKYFLSATQAKLSNSNNFKRKKNQIKMTSYS